jgi:pilus assembly protein Flp/PilA
MKSLIAFLKDEDGQTSTEYILLVAVVAMIVFKFQKAADKELTGITEKVFGKANSFIDQIQ